MTALNVATFIIVCQWTGYCPVQAFCPDIAHDGVSVPAEDPEYCTFVPESNEICCQWVYSVVTDKSKTASESYCTDAAKMCQWNYNGGGLEESGCGEGIKEKGCCTDGIDEDERWDEEKDWIKNCREHASIASCERRLSDLKGEDEDKGDFITAMILLGKSGYIKEDRTRAAAEVIWEVSHQVHADPYFIAAIGWIESRWRADLRSKTSDCGILQVNLRYTKYTCQQLMELGTGVKVGISKIRYWERRFAKREPKKKQWICHYNGGNVCGEKSTRYGKAVYRIFVRLNRLAGVK
jgi:hypothetical protein